MLNYRPLSGGIAMSYELLGPGPAKLNLVV